MKKMLIRASIFTVLSVTMMLHRSATKHILITDAAGQDVDREFSSESYNLLIDRNVSDRQAGKLTIPLSKSVSSDDIVMEDRYMDHELRIYIDGREEGFYLDNAVVSDLDIFEDAICITENETGSVCLDFKLDGIYANESSLTESSTIEVRFFKPSEEYDRVVVIDPVCGGSEAGSSFDRISEKDIALNVALALKASTDKDENNDIKFYYTRLSDVSTDDDKRLKLIEDTEADLVVRIDADTYADGADGIRAYYNDEFFLRSLNNAEFAGNLANACMSSAGTGIVGIYPEFEDDAILSQAKVPAVKVSVGALNGSADHNRLQDKTYIMKLSSGLYQGIMDAFEEMK